VHVEIAAGKTRNTGWTHWKHRQSCSQPDGTGRTGPAAVGASRQYAAPVDEGSPTVSRATRGVRTGRTNGGLGIAHGAGQNATP